MPSSLNINTCILSKLLDRFQQNFIQWQTPPNTLRGWSKHAHEKYKIADSYRFWKSLTTAKICFSKQTARRPWKFTLTSKLIRAGNQTCLPCEFGVNPFSGFRDILHKQKDTGNAKNRTLRSSLFAAKIANRNISLWFQQSTRDFVK